MLLLVRFLTLGLLLATGLRVDRVAEIKKILKRTLEECKAFNQYCDNETMVVLFNQKLKDVSSIHYYIFQDSLIYDCIEYEDILRIERLLENILEENNETKKN
jgi:predicted AAA+ superfamily ATPase